MTDRLLTDGLASFLLHGFLRREPITTNILCLRKAKFHHAILVADKSEAGRRPTSSLL